MTRLDAEAITAAVMILGGTIGAILWDCRPRRTRPRQAEAFLRPKAWNLARWRACWNPDKCKRATRRWIWGTPYTYPWKDLWWSPAPDEWRNTWQESIDLPGHLLHPRTNSVPKRAQAYPKGQFPVKQHDADRFVAPLRELARWYDSAGDKASNRGELKLAAQLWTTSVELHRVARGIRSEIMDGAELKAGAP